MTAEGARAIIGEQDDGDYILAPGEHAALYKKTAPVLAELLRRSGPTAEAKAFAERDKEAVEAQGRYKTWMRLTNLAVLATTALGAAAMGAAILWPVPGGTDGTLGRGLSVTAALVSAFGMFGLFRLREGKLIETWMAKRAAAETRRIGYFAALGTSVRDSVDPDLLSLTLEYFRRYQFDVQHVFYSQRSQDHAKSADFTVTIGGTGAFIAAAASGVAAALGGPWTALGAVAVAGAALGAYSVGREQMTQDRRNAERYSRTADALTEIEHRLDDVRTAAASGNGAAVVEFIAAANEQISLEHRQWLEGAETAKTALAKLEVALGRNETTEQGTGGT